MQLLISEIDIITSDSATQIFSNVRAGFSQMLHDILKLKSHSSCAVRDKSCTRRSTHVIEPTAASFRMCKLCKAHVKCGACIWDNYHPGGTLIENWMFLAAGGKGFVCWNAKQAKYTPQLKQWKTTFTLPLMPHLFWMIVWDVFLEVYLEMIYDRVRQLHVDFKPATLQNPQWGTKTWKMTHYFSWVWNECNTSTKTTQHGDIQIMYDRLSAPLTSVTTPEPDSSLSF